MDYQERVPNELLVRARLEKGWTQAHLAEEVGTTFETVSRWERGVVIPGLFYRERLCGVFGKTARELGLDETGAASLTGTDLTRIVFLSSAYADAESKFVIALKKKLAMRDITVWSSGLVKRQSAHHKSGILEEAIRAVQLVLVILSPHSKGSSLYNHIITTIERVWLTAGDPGTIELSEPMWNVPEPTKPLVGREKLLTKVSELLRGPHTRLITLTGPGGIGKTHLALQVAMEVRERFVDGTCFVSLTAIHDPMLVVQLRTCPGSIGAASRTPGGLLSSQDRRNQSYPAPWAG